MSLLCDKPTRKVKVEGDILCITVELCRTCEECRTKLKRRSLTPKNDRQRQLKKAYWNLRSQEKEIIEIVNVD